MRPKERKICICLPSYNAEAFVRSTTSRIPWDRMPSDLEYCVLYVDNRSRDATWQEIAACRGDLAELGRASDAIRNAANLGYGGSVKVAFDYCHRNHFDVLVILHADGQYRPEDLPRLIAGFRQHADCAMFYGSRLLGDALAGGMPFYKYLGNIALTWLQNRALRTDYSEFHSGYRLYRIDSIASLPYHRNSDYFDFDNHIIFQIRHRGYRIGEASIPTHYGEQKSHVGLIRTPLAIVANTAAYLLHKWGLVRVRRYELLDDDSSSGGGSLRGTAPRHVSSDRAMIAQALDSRTEFSD